MLKANNFTITVDQAFSVIGNCQQDHRQRHPSTSNALAETKLRKALANCKSEDRDSCRRLYALLDEVLPLGTPSIEPAELKRLCVEEGIALSGAQLAVATQDRERDDPLRAGMPLTKITSNGVRVPSPDQDVESMKEVQQAERRKGSRASSDDGKTNYGHLHALLASKPSTQKILPVDIADEVRANKISLSSQ